LKKINKKKKKKLKKAFLKAKHLKMLSLVNALT